MSSEAAKPVRAQNASLTRWIVPSRWTIAMPVGASSNAERKRLSLSLVARRASSLARHTLTLTTASPRMKSAWMPAHSTGLCHAAGWLKTWCASIRPPIAWCSATKAIAST